MARVTADTPVAGGVPRWVVGYLLPALGILALVLLSFALGKFQIAPGELARIVDAKLFGTAHGLPETYDAVVWRIWMPRIATSCLVGAGLAAAGATYQGLFRNPLVSPDILGVSSGAGFGAALAILLSLPVVAVQGMAFAFGLTAVAAVYFIAKLSRPYLLAQMRELGVPTVALDCGNRLCATESATGEKPVIPRFSAAGAQNRPCAVAGGCRS